VLATVAGCGCGGGLVGLAGEAAEAALADVPGLCRNGMVSEVASRAAVCLALLADVLGESDLRWPGRAAIRWCAEASASDCLAVAVGSAARAAGEPGSVSPSWPDDVASSCLQGLRASLRPSGWPAGLPAASAASSRRARAAALLLTLPCWGAARQAPAAAVRPAVAAALASPSAPTLPSSALAEMCSAVADALSRHAALGALRQSAGGTVAAAALPGAMGDREAAPAASSGAFELCPRDASSLCERPSPAAAAAAAALAAVRRIQRCARTLEALPEGSGSAGVASARLQIAAVDAAVSTWRVEGGGGGGAGAAVSDSAPRLCPTAQGRRSVARALVVAEAAAATACLGRACDLLADATAHAALGCGPRGAADACAAALDAVASVMEAAAADLSAGAAAAAGGSGASVPAAIRRAWSSAGSAAGSVPPPRGRGALPAEDVGDWSAAGVAPGAAGCAASVLAGAAAAVARQCASLTAAAVACALGGLARCAVEEAGCSAGDVIRAVGHVIERRGGAEGPEVPGACGAVGVLVALYGAVSASVGLASPPPGGGRDAAWRLLSSSVLRPAAAAAGAVAREAAVWVAAAAGSPGVGGAVSSDGSAVPSRGEAGAAMAGVLGADAEAAECLRRGGAAGWSGEEEEEDGGGAAPLLVALAATLVDAAGAAAGAATGEGAAGPRDGLPSWSAVGAAALQHGTSGGFAADGGSDDDEGSGDDDGSDDDDGGKGGGVVTPEGIAAAAAAVAAAVRMGGASGQHPMRRSARAAVGAPPSVTAGGKAAIVAGGGGQRVELHAADVVALLQVQGGTDGAVAALASLAAAAEATARWAAALPDGWSPAPETDAAPRAEAVWAALALRRACSGSAGGGGGGASAAETAASLVGGSGAVALRLERRLVALRCGSAEPAAWALRLPAVRRLLLRGALALQRLAGSAERIGPGGGASPLGGLCDAASLALASLRGALDRGAIPAHAASAALAALAAAAETTGMGPQAPTHSGATSAASLLVDAPGGTSRSDAAAEHGAAAWGPAGSLAGGFRAAAHGRAVGGLVPSAPAAVWAEGGGGPVVSPASLQPPPLFLIDPTGGFVASAALLGPEGHGSAASLASMGPGGAAASLDGLGGASARSALGGSALSGVSPLPVLACSALDEACGASASAVGALVCGFAPAVEASGVLLAADAWASRDAAAWAAVLAGRVGGTAAASGHVLAAAAGLWGALSSSLGPGEGGLAAAPPAVSAVAPVVEVALALAARPDDDEEEEEEEGTGGEASPVPSSLSSSSSAAAGAASARPPCALRAVIGTRGRAWGSAASAPVQSDDEPACAPLCPGVRPAAMPPSPAPDIAAAGFLASAPDPDATSSAWHPCLWHPAVPMWDADGALGLRAASLLLAAASSLAAAPASRAAHVASQSRLLALALPSSARSPHRPAAALLKALAVAAAGSAHVTVRAATLAGAAPSAGAWSLPSSAASAERLVASWSALAAAQRLDADPYPPASLGPGHGFAPLVAWVRLPGALREAAVPLLRAAGPQWARERRVAARRGLGPAGRAAVRRSARLRCGRGRLASRAVLQAVERAGADGDVTPAAVSSQAVLSLVRASRHAAASAAPPAPSQASSSFSGLAPLAEDAAWVDSPCDVGDDGVLRPSARAAVDAAAWGAAAVLCPAEHRAPSDGAPSPLPGLSAASCESVATLLCACSGVAIGVVSLAPAVQLCPGLAVLAVPVAAAALLAAHGDPLVVTTDREAVPGTARGSLVVSGSLGLGGEVGSPFVAALDTVVLGPAKSRRDDVPGPPRTRAVVLGPGAALVNACLASALRSGTPGLRAAAVATVRTLRSLRSAVVTAGPSVRAAGARGADAVPSAAVFPDELRLRPGSAASPSHPSGRRACETARLVLHARPSDVVAASLRCGDAAAALEGCQVASVGLAEAGALVVSRAARAAAGRHELPGGITLPGILRSDLEAARSRAGRVPSSVRDARADLERAVDAETSADGRALCASAPSVWWAEAAGAALAAAGPSVMGAGLEGATTGGWRHRRAAAVSPLDGVVVWPAEGAEVVVASPDVDPMGAGQSDAGAAGGRGDGEAGAAAGAAGALVSLTAALVASAEAAGDADTRAAVGPAEPSDAGQQSPRDGRESWGWSGDGDVAPSRLCRWDRGLEDADAVTALFLGEGSPAAAGWTAVGPRLRDACRAAAAFGVPPGVTAGQDGPAAAVASVLVASALPGWGGAALQRRLSESASGRGAAAPAAEQGSSLRRALAAAARRCALLLGPAGRDDGAALPGADAAWLSVGARALGARWPAATDGRRPGPNPLRLALPSPSLASGLSPVSQALSETPATPSPGSAGRLLLLARPWVRAALSALPRAAPSSLSAAAPLASAVEAVSAAAAAAAASALSLSSRPSPAGPAVGLHREALTAALGAGPRPGDGAWALGAALSDASSLMTLLAAWRAAGAAPRADDDATAGGAHGSAIDTAVATRLGAPLWRCGSPLGPDPGPGDDAAAPDQWQDDAGGRAAGPGSAAAPLGPGSLAASLHAVSTSLRASDPGPGLLLGRTAPPAAHPLTVLRPREPSARIRAWVDAGAASTRSLAAAHAGLAASAGAASASWAEERGHHSLRTILRGAAASRRGLAPGRAAPLPLLHAASFAADFAVQASRAALAAPSNPDDHHSRAAPLVPASACLTPLLSALAARRTAASAAASQDRVTASATEPPPPSGPPAPSQPPSSSSSSSSSAAPLPPALSPADSFAAARVDGALASAGTALRQRAGARLALGRWADASFQALRRHRTSAAGRAECARAEAAVAEADMLAAAWDRLENEVAELRRAKSRLKPQGGGRGGGRRGAGRADEDEQERARMTSSAWAAVREGFGLGHASLAAFQRDRAQAGPGVRALCGPLVAAREAEDAALQAALASYAGFLSDVEGYASLTGHERRLGAGPVGGAAASLEASQRLVGLVTETRHDVSARFCAGRAVLQVPAGRLADLAAQLVGRLGAGDGGGEQGGGGGGGSAAVHAFPSVEPPRSGSAMLPPPPRRDPPSFASLVRSAVLRAALVAPWDVVCRLVAAEDCGGGAAGAAGAAGAEGAASRAAAASALLSSIRGVGGAGYQAVVEACRITAVATGAIARGAVTKDDKGKPLPLAGLPVEGTAAIGAVEEAVRAGGAGGAVRGQRRRRKGRGQADTDALPASSPASAAAAAGLSVADLWPTRGGTALRGLPALPIVTVRQDSDSGAGSVAEAVAAACVAVIEHRRSSGARVTGGLPAWVVAEAEAEFEAAAAGTRTAGGFARATALSVAAASACGAVPDPSAASPPRSGRARWAAVDGTVGRARAELLRASAAGAIGGGSLLRPAVRLLAAEDDATVSSSGLSLPKIVALHGSDGRRHRQVVKPDPDLRQDELMQSYLSACNAVLLGDAEARRRGLALRTYRVVPTSRAAGAIEFVRGAVPLNEPLADLHARHRPHDSPPSQVMARVGAAEREPLRSRVRLLRRVFTSMVRPAMHWLFLERFPAPEAAAQRRAAFAASLAASSAAGHVVGLGDRHLTNVMLVPQTAEVVHIDFGVCFEQGALLRTPELVPFRLTRDLVAGLGAAGVDGGFGRGLECTMRVLRGAPEALLAVVGVLLDDPLCRWVDSERRRGAWARRVRAARREAERAAVERSRSRSVSVSRGGSVARGASVAGPRRGDDEDEEGGSGSPGLRPEGMRTGSRSDDEAEDAEDDGDEGGRPDTLASEASAGYAPEALRAQRAHAAAGRLDRLAAAAARGGGGAGARARRVLARCEDKLNGRESPAALPMGVAEQCRYLVGQATDLRNLAQLYKGWQAWM